MKKRVTAFFLMIAAMMGAAGCKTNFLPERREIDDLQLVQVLGIDKSVEIPGSQVLTIASRKDTPDTGLSRSQQHPGSSGEGEISLGNKAFISTAQGKTLFEAVWKMQASSDKFLFWAHTKYYLIGEEAAKDNIAKYIDFIARDNEFHINSKVYIVKGTTAKELIEQVNKSDLYIADKLDSLGQTIKMLSTSEELTLAELMRFFDIHFGSARIPCIELVDRGSGQGQLIPAVESFGYAVVANLKLVSYIGRDISRGVNLITNKMESTIVTVKDLNGEDASLEIISSKTEAAPRYAGDELTDITLKTKVEGNLGEVQSQAHTIYEENFKHMEVQLSEILENEMRSVLQVVRESESDCLGICDMLRLKDPVKWHKIESRWMEILSHLNIHVEVESELRRSYELGEPSSKKDMK
ncbi:MAG TPA: Ger(x)C family spore germination protein [Clostridiales bacterium]|nr:Ger(x)C family spore germination protein [Clostridiales bacterium]